MKDYERMGIASELVRQCVEYAKQNKFKKIKLEVHEDSIPAIHLYKKFGFTDSGRKGDFIQMELGDL
jgi:ribosomal protein S18 acetylase RimI-like enzyme